MSKFLKKARKNACHKETEVAVHEDEVQEPIRVQPHHCQSRHAM